MRSTVVSVMEVFILTKRKLSWRKPLFVDERNFLGRTIVFWYSPDKWYSIKVTESARSMSWSSTLTEALWSLKYK